MALPAFVIQAQDVARPLIRNVSMAARPGAGDGLPPPARSTAARRQSWSSLPGRRRKAVIATPQRLLPDPPVPTLDSPGPSNTWPAPGPAPFFHADGTESPTAKVDAIPLGVSGRSLLSGFIVLPRYWTTGCSPRTGGWRSRRRRGGSLGDLPVSTRPDPVTPTGRRGQGLVPRAGMVRNRPPARMGHPGAGLWGQFVVRAVDRQRRTAPPSQRSALQRQLAAVVRATGCACCAHSWA